ncbi:Crp/Fnr family transcriptional regulator, partial [Brucella sp. 21LCYQ03]|nr:Crp/Fnr family transcriptional regulator [Brucella sp. 21LCYQ03]
LKLKFIILSGYKIFRGRQNILPMNDVLKEHIAEIIELNDDDYHVIAEYFRTIKFRKWQFVIQENQTVDKIYFVLEGLLQSSFVDNYAREHILHFATKNWWITDFQAYFKREVSTAAVQCLEDCVLLSISFDDVDKLCKAKPQMERFFRMKCNNAYLALQSRIISLMSNSAKERYSNFIKENPDLFQKLSKK